MKFHRNEPNCSASDVAIPLPPPPRFEDFTDVGGDPSFPDVGVEHGPFLPSALNNFFGDIADINDDFVTGQSHEFRRLYAPGTTSLTLRFL